MSRLDDTRNCPQTRECESCGCLSGSTVRRTLTTRLGVLCASVCQPCVDRSARLGPMGVVTVVERVAEHCGHLGIDMDEAARLFAAEHGPDEDAEVRGDGG